MLGKRGRNDSDVGAPGEEVEPEPPKRVQIEVTEALESPNDEFQMCQRLLVEGSVAGGLIGSQGHVIQKLRADSKATIEVSSEVSRRAPRIVTIRGPTNIVAVAVKLITIKIAELERAFHGDDAIPYTVTLLVADANLGSVIGRRGATISSTRKAATGAKIKVSGECLPRSTEKTIDIEGELESVETAITLVVTQLGTNQQNKGRTNVHPYTPIPDDQERDYYPPPGERERYSPRSRGGGGSRGGGESRDFYPDRRAPHPEQYMTSANVVVPNRLIGGVIGRGGHKISNVRSVSGAEVKVPDRDPQSSERVLMVRGYREQVDRAVQMIYEAMAEQDPSYSGDMQGGAQYGGHQQAGRGGWGGGDGGRRGGEAYPSNGWDSRGGGGGYGQPEYDYNYQGAHSRPRQQYGSDYYSYNTSGQSDYPS